MVYRNYQIIYSPLQEYVFYYRSIFERFLVFSLFVCSSSHRLLYLQTTHSFVETNKEDIVIFDQNKQEFFLPFVKMVRFTFFTANYLLQILPKLLKHLNECAEYYVVVFRIFGSNSCKLDYILLRLISKALTIDRLGTPVLGVLRV